MIAQIVTIRTRDGREVEVRVILATERVFQPGDAIVSTQQVTTTSGTDFQTEPLFQEIFGEMTKASTTQGSLSFAEEADFRRKLA